MNAENPLELVGRNADTDVEGEFVKVDGERFYVIRNVDKMAPFFINVVSGDDLWLFVSSTGGLSAGRVSPETALFPYVTVDKIHDSTTHTGCVTYLRIHDAHGVSEWQPFGDALSSPYTVTRNLYKSAAGDKLRFEEINEDLGVVFRYVWTTSNRYGFVRTVEIENQRAAPLTIDILDGLRNILPAGTPRFTQTNSSNLVDAYKWTELDSQSGLALYTLYSGITDRAEPCESLRANVVYCLGIDEPTILLSSEQLARFRTGQLIAGESLKRGIRGDFLIQHRQTLVTGATTHWHLVANTELSQADVVALQQSLADRAALQAEILASVDRSSDRLARIMGAADAYQTTAEDNVTAHHYANVLFNVMRGGIFADQYRLSARDLSTTIANFNRVVHQRHEALFESLPATLTLDDFASRVEATGDRQLQRLCYEYLPITFGRRHGDPSRPWNQFAIRLRDDEGNAYLSYEGNWRDIFQNWEALTFSYPEFIGNVVAKFVNASTMDGYNPYRITKEGIDWEVEEPDDPWSYIGYWGDHQIIYLLKLLELSRAFQPQSLYQLLHLPIFSYANVPYRVRGFEASLANPKETVDFDEAAAERIEARVAAMGADGKLVLNREGDVYQVPLLEKLLVPLLAKLGNLVVDGGIWLNTQRPEWNDANNALVGQGLSMVTLYYLRRYLTFMTDLIANDDTPASLSQEVADWFTDTATTLADMQPVLGNGPVSAAQRFASLRDLGMAAERYRTRVYAEGFSGETTAVAVADIRNLLADALRAVDHSIASNRRDDGLYHAYNVMENGPGTIDVARLYPMLEGQVSVLSAGALDASQAIDVVEALFASAVYRPDQKSFLLYPDRDLPGFLDKNLIAPDRLAAIAPLAEMVARGDTRLVVRDPEGRYRFNDDFVNVGSLNDALDKLAEEDAGTVAVIRKPICALYEDVFAHQEFTGRSGTMFGFEGLGCIYWHMVAKLLLAVQENFRSALASNGSADELQHLGALYYRVREGIGFNKTPDEFGAFPTDPYSHTPAHSGARQPGMTGQVKEEILTRFGELGIVVADGRVRFRPALLKAREFTGKERTLRYLDVDNEWQELSVPAGSIAFTWCQIPIIYSLINGTGIGVQATFDNNDVRRYDDGELPSDDSALIFERSGRIRRIDVAIGDGELFHEPQ